jgi:hypothetical protein
MGIAVIKAVNKNTIARVMSDGFKNLFSIIPIDANEMIVAMVQTNILEPWGKGTNTAKNSYA